MPKTPKTQKTGVSHDRTSNINGNLSFSTLHAEITLTQMLSDKKFHDVILKSGIDSIT